MFKIYYESRDSVESVKEGEDVGVVEPLAIKHLSPPLSLLSDTHLHDGSNRGHFHLP